MKFLADEGVDGSIVDAIRGWRWLRPASRYHREAIAAFSSWPSFRRIGVFYFEIIALGAIIEE